MNSKFIYYNEKKKVHIENVSLLFILKYLTMFEKITWQILFWNSVMAKILQQHKPLLD